MEKIKEISNSEKCKLYYQNNKEKEKLRKKKYYEENKKIILDKENLKYYNDPEKYKIKNSNHYNKNKSDHLKNVKDYYYNNHDEIKLKNKKYRNSKEGKLNKLNSSLKCNYNITLEDYNQMFDFQEGNCAICNINQSKLNKRLCVDHDHNTGKVRALLCNCCNIGIGQFKDNQEILIKASNYLKYYE